MWTAKETRFVRIDTKIHFETFPLSFRLRPRIKPQFSIHKQPSLNNFPFGNRRCAYSPVHEENFNASFPKGFSRPTFPEKAPPRINWANSSLLIHYRLIWRLLKGTHTFIRRLGMYRVLVIYCTYSPWYRKLYASLWSFSDRLMTLSVLSHFPLPYVTLATVNWIKHNINICIFFM